MKKVLKLIGLLILTIIIGTGISVFIMLNKGNFNKTYNIKKYGMKIKIPYSYESIYEGATNQLLNLVNNQNGISVTVMEFQDEFWSSGDAMSRMDEYMQIVSTANYGKNVKNVKLEEIDIANEKIGRVELEVSLRENSQKIIALITEETKGNIVIEIGGATETVQKNIEEIEKIINSIIF